MRCDEVTLWLDACLDNEADADRAAQVRDHLSSCPACSVLHADRTAQRAALEKAMLRFTAPQSLRDAVEHQIRGAGFQPGPESTHGAPPPIHARIHRTPTWAWLSLAACLALTLTVIRLGAASYSRSAALSADAGEAVSSHIRSLMASHLFDVASTDQHTVKPWFSGKLDFAPPVIDLSPQGFPLAGGRLDYLAGHPAAALVYSRRAHTINLFISPEPSSSPPAPSSIHPLEDRGYHIAAWSDSGMRFLAVSDLSQDELLTFAHLIHNQLAPQPGERRP